MARLSEHRAPIKRRVKIDLEPSMSDTIKGLISQYDKVDRTRTAELAKPRKERDAAKIKRAAEILKTIDHAISSKGYKINEELKKLRAKGVH